VTFETDLLGPLSNSTDAPSFGVFGSPVFAEMDGEGEVFTYWRPPQVWGVCSIRIFPRGRRRRDNHLSAWDMTGAMLPAFPRHVNDLPVPERACRRRHRR